MYKKGDLNVTTPRCEKTNANGRCSVSGHTHCVYDTLDDIEHAEGAYLPHSCEEWVIGGAEQIKALIADLTAALSRIEGE